MKTSEVERIGPWRWPVVIELEGDIHERAIEGEDFTQASWEGLPAQMWQVHQFYVDERLRRRGSDIPRAAATFRNICTFFGPDADPTKLRIANFARRNASRDPVRRGPGRRFPRGCGRAAVPRMRRYEMTHGFQFGADTK